MVMGEVARWMQRLKAGEAVVLTIEELTDSAKYFLESGFDCVRKEDIKEVENQINSKEYPNFSITNRLDGKWTLNKYTSTYT